ncbi:MAG: hypothetical protein ACUVWX_09695, partial [Kiritimatiellia bacterium]
MKTIDRIWVLFTVLLGVAVVALAVERCQMRKRYDRTGARTDSAREELAAVLAYVEQLELDLAERQKEVAQLVQQLAHDETELNAEKKTHDPLRAQVEKMISEGIAFRARIERQEEEIRCLSAQLERAAAEASQLGTQNRRLVAELDVLRGR